MAVSAQRKPSTAAGKRTPYRTMALLLQVGKRIAAADTLDDVLKTIVEISARETDSDRGTLFLHDEKTGELYSRIALGNLMREIRIMNTSGIAGHVFQTGQSMIVDDAYSNPLFDRTVDDETKYVSKTILCVPIRFRKEIIGVLQMLNKVHGSYTAEDMSLLEAMAEQTVITLHSTLLVERIRAKREEEMEFLGVVSDVASRIDLSAMLAKVVEEAARMLRADRATLLLHDEKKDELFSRVAMGESVGEIRMPSYAGIAGSVFTSGKSINIPYAYADLRFNPSFDRKTGYFTRSILCVPIINKEGKIIGVTQALNKKGGPFTEEDEARLKAFTAQLAINLENAKLFDDVQNIKNYNESMLHSMSNGVITLNEEGRIVTCNQAGLHIWRVQPQQILGRTAQEFFSGENAWILERIKVVEETLKTDITMDAELRIDGEKVSVNLNVLPLMAKQEDAKEQKKIGSLLMIEDISSEKRMKTTMSRYMDPAVADQLLSGGSEILGGKSLTATVLFSDIRSFTSISEQLGAQATVSLLNEYFTLMVECIYRQGGMLDKFIGDAIMAVFGLPISKEDDEDRAVTAAISMIQALRSWNAERHASGKQPIEMGIGLNTDTVVSGNIGAPKRMDFTIIGDGVNLASRLESACKQYAARILISENTYRKLRGMYRIREVDRVVVKGKQQPIGIYEVLDYHTEESFPNMMEAVAYFKSGLSYYRKRQFAKAEESLHEALQLNPQDKLPQIYLERCAELKLSPPGEDWDGVWVLKSK
jgi:adenylate cyclase